MSGRTFSGAALQACVIGAAVFGSVALVSGPEAKAACIGGDNSCTTFDPTTTSSPSAIGGFDGAVTLAAGQQLDRFRVIFKVSNYVGPGFELSGISVAGDGIATRLSVPAVNIGANAVAIEYISDFVALNSPITSGQTLDYVRSNISFTIPAGLSPGSVITSELFYASNALSGGFPANSLTSGNDFTTTATGNPVPGPLPLVGAGAAFGFSRKLRRRVAKMP